ncbi:MAG: peptidylprolyl isomerase, partial [Bacteroidota bacterium]
VMEGADLGAVARRHSLRAASNDGVTGYFRTDERGDVGLAASIVDVGAVFGPVEVDEGYSFFRLLDRRPVPGFASRSVESASDRINRQIAGLARAYPVDVDMDLLRTVPVTRVNKIIYRYMGFGNRMPAAPTLHRMTQWLDYLEESDRPLAL